ncbi:MAG: hypothetical protein LBJ16_03710 [Holosporaceae bacterium]|nr:hypothetical protein [Holosporaceae bacterium]
MDKTGKACRAATPLPYMEIRFQKVAGPTEPLRTIFSRANFSFGDSSGISFA